MPRWRNWRLQYVDVQDRALELCPAMKSLVLSTTSKSKVTAKPQMKLTPVKSIQGKSHSIFVFPVCLADSAMV